MKLILFSDLHYYVGERDPEALRTSRKLTQYALPMLEQLIEKVNHEYRPDAVVNLGDSIQDAEDREVDMKGLSIVAEKLKEFRCPCYTVLGNHDLKMFDSKKEAEQIFGYERFTYSLDLCGYHLVFLTNDVKPELGIASGGIVKTHAMAESDIEWLREDLGQTDKPCLIFTHYAFFGENPNAVIKNSEAVIDAIEESKNVLAAFSGHTHVAYSNERNGVSYHVVGSPIASLERTGIPDAVYYEIDVCDRGVKVKEHLFDLSTL